MTEDRSYAASVDQQLATDRADAEAIDYDWQMAERVARDLLTRFLVQDVIAMLLAPDVTYRGSELCALQAFQEAYGVPDLLRVMARAVEAK